MRRFIYIFLILIFPIATVVAQVKVSNKNKAKWSKAGDWSPAGVPGPNDDVLIANGHKMQIDGDFACKSLTIGTTSTIQSALEFIDKSTAHSFTIFGNVLINDGDTFDIKNNSNVTHTVTFHGNIVNHGGIQFNADVNSKVNAVFVRNGNQSITGLGGLTKFSDIHLNMGNSSNNILEISASNFTVPVNFLKLTNGTLKLSTTNIQNITTFTASTIIPPTAGLWLNSNILIVNTQNTLINNGPITISNGTLNVGDGIGEDLVTNNSIVNLLAGNINAAGKYNANGTSTVSISNGTINVATLGSTDVVNSPFQISSAGSTFNMGNGAIVLNAEGGSGSQDLGYVNMAGISNVTGGTLQIGTPLSPSNQSMKLNSTALIGNLLINNSTATASVFANPMNVITNITINSGTFNANNLNVTLGGNWQNLGGVFIPGFATVTFSSSIAQTIFKSGGETFNHLTFSGTGIKTLGSAIRTNGNLLINNGSTLDISSSNHQITCLGNFTKNGIFNPRFGLVFFNGTTLQNISGSGATDFFDLTLNNTSGASLSNSLNLYGTLRLNNGVFTTNFNSFTMVSTATATARIDQITGTGDINGLITVQRFVPGGTTGWALLGAPISTGLTYADWDDNIYISCTTCPDGSASGFLSIYSYDETAVGSYSNPISYIPISTINDPIAPNKGYWVYMGNGQYTTNDINIDLIGAVRKFNQTLPLSYSNYGSPSEDGWNLITNPYPSAISWTALKGTTSNIDNAIYAYNADLNAGQGGNATFINGISSPAIGSGGIGDVIPMCQGFYVHSTGATALNATEAIKTAGNPTFLKSATTNTIEGLLRLKMDGPYGFNDESVLYMQQGATSNFDGDYDAIKMAGQNIYAPTIALQKNNSTFQVNGVAPIAGTFTTELLTLTGYSDTYTISINELNGFPNGACLNLYDRFTSTSTDLIKNNYVFNLADTTTAARFVLSITINKLKINSTVEQPTCSKLRGGEITVKGISAGPWNYIWKDETGSIVRTKLNVNTEDTISDLVKGKYSLEVNTIGLCDNHKSSFMIYQKIPSYAQFTVIDTCYLNQNPSIEFRNTSLNSVSQNWNFGDFTALSTDFSPNHIFSDQGVYKVKLEVVSNTGCVDSLSKKIVVLDRPVGIETNLEANQEIILKTLPENKFLVEKKLVENSDISSTVIDINGKIIISEINTNAHELKLNINLNSFNSGIYFLHIKINNELVNFKLPVKK